MDFSEQKRPIDRAMYLVEEAGKAFKYNKDVKAFVAPARLTNFMKDDKGPYNHIQTRIVVVCLEDKPVEVLFLNNNDKKVLNRLKELSVPVSEEPGECKEARVVALKEMPPKVKVPTLFPKETKVFEEKKDLLKPKKMGRPKKVKDALGFAVEKREKERKEKYAPSIAKRKPRKKKKTKEEKE